MKINYTIKKRETKDKFRYLRQEITISNNWEIAVTIKQKSETETRIVYPLCGMEGRSLEFTIMFARLIRLAYRIAERNEARWQQIVAEQKKKVNLESRPPARTGQGFTRYTTMGMTTA